MRHRRAVKSSCHGVTRASSTISNTRNSSRLRQSSLETKCLGSALEEAKWKTKAGERERKKKKKQPPLRDCGIFEEHISNAKDHIPPFRVLDHLIMMPDLT